MASAHIDKGRLSLCFNSLGNIVRELFGTVRGCLGTVWELFGFAQGCVSPPGVASGLFGLVRVASGLFGTVRVCSRLCKPSGGCLGTVRGLYGFDP